MSEKIRNTVDDEIYEVMIIITKAKSVLQLFTEHYGFDFTTPKSNNIENLKSDWSMASDVLIDVSDKLENALALLDSIK